MTEIRIVDAWAQHPTWEFLDHEMFASLRRWLGVERFPDITPVEKTLEAMAKGGVHQALLSSWWGPDGPILTNEDVHKIVEQHPDRFAGIASVDLRRPTEAVRQLRECRDMGFRGVRVIPWLWGLPPNHRLYYPLYAECVELGVPFCLQVGHTGPMLSSEPGRPIPYLDQVALDFPELTIVAGHIGFPWTNEMISLATKYENVYIDTSAYTIRRYPREIVDYLRGHGKHKVLFGTNYPMVFPEAALKGLGELGLEEKTKRLFLEENARRVFGLE